MKIKLGFLVLALVVELSATQNFNYNQARLSFLLARYARFKTAHASTILQAEQLVQLKDQKNIKNFYTQHQHVFLLREQYEEAIAYVRAQIQKSS